MPAQHLKTRLFQQEFTLWRSFARAFDIIQRRAFLFAQKRITVEQVDIACRPILNRHAPEFPRGVHARVVMPNSQFFDVSDRRHAIECKHVDLKETRS